MTRSMFDADRYVKELNEMGWLVAADQRLNGWTVSFRQTNNAPNNDVVLRVEK